MKEPDSKKILDAFIKTCRNPALLKSKNFNYEQMNNNLAEVYKALGVAKIELKKTNHSENQSSSFNSDAEIYYEAGSPDTERLYASKTLSNEYVDATYIFYPHKDGLPFTEQEKECLEFLAYYIFLLGTDINLTKHLNFALTHELRFRDSYNISFLTKKIEQLIKENKTGSFGLLQYNIKNFSNLTKQYGEDNATEILNQYHAGISKILEGNIDENGFDVALDGDNGFILFNKNYSSQILAFLFSSLFTVKNITGAEETIEINSRYGINTELAVYTSAHAVISTVATAYEIMRRNPGLKFVEYNNVFKNKLEMENKIEAWYVSALQNGEFHIYYQPKVNLHNYKLKGAEALVRWNHEDAIILPDEFIPVLENNLSIRDLDFYMLNHVCMNIKNWLEEGKDVPKISVNLSRATLKVMNLVKVITSTIDNYGIPRSLIEIELTESASDASNEDLRPLVTGLNREGITTAVDDFGTGFSSLILIKELPWDVLKIDKSLLKGAHKDGSRDQLMFKSIISMAQTLGLECIVEGVETKDDVRILKESGCYNAQGFYFSKPLPKEDFEKLLV